LPRAHKEDNCLTFEIKDIHFLDVKYETCHLKTMSKSIVHIVLHQGLPLIKISSILKQTRLEKKKTKLN
jgi:hypothetical protein